MDLFDEIRDKKILLVDDDEGIRDSLKMYFQGEGLRIDTLETAEEGIDALKDRRYDIIIADSRLPGMDGLSFLRHSHVLCPDSFRILITTQGSREVLSHAAEIGVEGYIEKPFTTRIIRDTLARFTEKT